MVTRMLDHKGPFYVTDRGVSMDLENTTLHHYRLADGTILEFKSLLKESSRTYYFPNGVQFTIKNAVRIAIRPTSHRIETADGKRFIVPGKFIAIAIDSEGWSA